MKRFNSYITEQKNDFVAEAEEFIHFACEWLELEETPEVFLINDKKLAVEQKSFGGYSPSEKNIRVNIAERHKVDVFRTLAHELVHFKQDVDDRLEEDSGETGSDIENEANSIAGIILREYAKETEGKIFEEYENDGEYLNEGSWQIKHPKGFGWSEKEKSTADYLAKRHNGRVIKLSNGEYGIEHPTSKGAKGKKHFDAASDFRYELKEDDEDGQMHSINYVYSKNANDPANKHILGKTRIRAKSPEGAKTHLRKLLTAYKLHLHHVSVLK